MPEYQPKIIKSAHKHSSSHYSEIKESEICGCFYCLKTFSPKEIEEWVEEPDNIGFTAICPKCGFDSVIGSKSGYPVDNEDFLSQMSLYWFSTSD